MLALSGNIIVLLLVKVFEELSHDLMLALSEENQNEPLVFAQNVMARIYAVLRTERYAKLIGWIVLSTELGELEDFIKPLPALTAIVAEHMAKHLPPKLANKLAAQITYNLSITAIGEGLVGPAVKVALSMDEKSANGAAWLGAYWSDLLEQELEKRNG